MIEDPNFSLHLESPWVRVPGEEEELYNFRDDERDIVITISALPLEIGTAAIDAVADKLVQFRLNAEAEAAHALDRRLTVYEPIVVPRPWGRAIAYYGHDNSGRQFSFSGILTVRTAISLYMSSAKLSERALMEAMDEVGSRIVFDRTPLGEPPGATTAADAA